MKINLEAKSNELITVYTDDIPSSIQNIKKYILEQEPKVQLMSADISQQIKELNQFLCQMLWGQLQLMGVFSGKGSIADLKTKGGLIDLYHRWMEESIEVLTKNNYLLYDGETYAATGTTQVDTNLVWKEWDLKKEIWLKDPQIYSQVVLSEATLIALPEILTGKIPATDVIFPNSSMELVERVYQHNVVADYFNEVLADTLVSYVQERIRQDSTVQLRILEIGAGTGGTSAMVFAKLQLYSKHIQEYCYTDISQAFLQHAEKVYGTQNPYLKYRIFNVEEPMAGQGMSAGRYDIVIAANVLHATKNIRQTLQNAKAALKKNGLILLNEITGKSLFSHLTFGLLKGWWLYEDAGLRIPGCPGLSPQTWKAVLESEGFRSVFFPVEEAGALGQQIIAAESNGVVRQKQGLKLGRSPEMPVARLDRPTVPVKRAPVHEPSAAPGKMVTQDLLREKSTAYIKKLIGETLGMPVHKIDSSEPLQKYGIDSILVVKLTDTLRKVFANIGSTLFFEYQTIDDLIQYFMETQKDKLIALVGLEEKEPGRESFGNVGSPGLPPMPALPGYRKTRRSQLPETEPEKPAPSNFIAQDIAIIGLSGRYAGADNVNEFGANLKKGKNCITEIPGDRWDWREYFDQAKGKPGSVYTKWGGFIRDIDKFDPLFFHISPAEAEYMDPQERLFLETCYASIEDAGYTPANLCESGKIGVFAGVMNGNYSSGASYWSIANRVSYLFNFQGPSIAIDTACSSSLTAVHLALESIYSGTSECAIAGGVNLIVDPVHYMRLAAATMLSAGDSCKSFGDQADGFVDGEGVGAIVLKPLARAIEDGDHIYGIIKGSMINAGGKTNGYTVPNPNAQARLISEALQRTKVHARTISYIEAHGTGTALGDPIEIAGLTKAFEKDTTVKQFCAIGSVKSNIGHCESAAGIAGLTKILLQFKYQQLMPSLHSQTLNSNIDFAGTPFVVQQEIAPWKRPVISINGETAEWPRIAGISSFGAGGANAFVVIEEYIPKDQARRSIDILVHNPVIIVLSARNENHLGEQVQRLLSAVHEQQFSKDSLADIAYTLQVGREAMEERLAVIAGSIKELEEKLQGYLEGRDDIPDLYRGQVKRSKETQAIFTADEDMQKAIEAWITKGKYGKLLSLWVDGLSFDWNKLYSSIKPHRISLPTYPFARERYWAAKTATAAPVATSVHPLPHQNTSNLSQQRFTSTFPEAEEAFELMTFEETWQEQVLPDNSSARIKAMVCFLSDSKKQQAAIEAVQALDGQTSVIFISQSTSYRKQSEQAYRISPKDPDTYKDAFKSIREDYGNIDAVLYLWPLEDKKHIRDYSCIVHILQGISFSKLKPSHILLAAQYEDMLERCHLESWIGFERSLGLVMPDTRIAAIMQESEENREPDIKDWLQKLWREMPTPKNSSILYQEGKRYICRIRPTKMQPGNSLLKPGGTYLITGGCGGLGLQLAGHLAKTQHANLILTGRSPMDEKKQMKIKILEDLGGQVLYLQADVCDQARMKEGLSQAKERFGEIRGVVHAAGLAGGGSILDKDISSFEEVLGPKIKGTIILDELLCREPLDFICYFSSSAAILGDFGSCDYAVGNRFLMAYGHYRNNQQPGKTVVINWPLWKEGGMGAKEGDNAEMYLKSSGQRFLETEEGIFMFDRLLAQNDIQHLVLAGQPSRVHRFLGLAGNQSPAQTPDIYKPSGKGRRTEMKGLSLEQCLEWDLKELAGNVLKIPREKLDKEE
ncbi:Beta-ketoacyl synthase, partial [Ruminiclostridium papyrosolvens DSM 2782]